MPSKGTRQQKRRETFDSKKLDLLLTTVTALLQLAGLAVALGSTLPHH